MELLPRLSLLFFGIGFRYEIHEPRDNRPLAAALVGLEALGRDVEGDLSGSEAVGNLIERSH
ncbi:hypothetical protein D3C71_1903660 [compost metagenome]